MLVIWDPLCRPTTVPRQISVIALLRDHDSIINLKKKKEKKYLIGKEIIFKIFFFKKRDFSLVSGVVLVPGIFYYFFNLPFNFGNRK